VLELRQKVEQLAAQVETVQKEQQSLLDVYLQRRQEVQALILREKFRGDQLKAQKVRLGEALKKNRLDAAGAPKAPDWYPPMLARLELAVARGLPLGEALNEADKIRGTLASGKTTVEMALIQTWFLLESNLKKRTTTEFMLTPVRLNDEGQPAEVVRLGDLLAYVRTADGKYGMLTRQAEAKWKLQEFTDKGEREQIEKLLAQFKTNQKTGLYQLPGMRAFVDSVRARKIQ
jgi:hypothetical protein